VPSPIACDQSSSFLRSISLSNRSQACTMSPASVHALWRRQQVEELGYRSGPLNSQDRACHRAPVLRTQRIPSRHSRGSVGGRPPAGDGSGFSNKSEMSFHWESVTNGFGAVLDPVVFGRRRWGHIDRVMSM
jgi:hypothetical protein